MKSEKNKERQKCKPNMNHDHAIDVFLCVGVWGGFQWVMPN